jgi:vanillate monooxygenase ferredoxin subunit
VSRVSSIGAEFELHYCSRTAERTAFALRIQASPFSDRVAFHFHDGDQGQKFDLDATPTDAPAGTHLYMCGPRGFMNAALEAARQKGWDEARLHYEFFGAVVEKPASDKTFKIRLANSGATFDVPPESTVVEALTACEQGVCGTCVTRILEGQPDHRIVT